MFPTYRAKIPIRNVWRLLKLNSKLSQKLLDNIWNLFSHSSDSHILSLSTCLFGIVLLASWDLLKQHIAFFIFLINHWQKTETFFFIYSKKTNIYITRVWPIINLTERADIDRVALVELKSVTWCVTDNHSVLENTNRQHFLRDFLIKCLCTILYYFCFQIYYIFLFSFCADLILYLSVNNSIL